MARTGPIALRAAVTVALMVGFYATALAIAAALAYLPIAELVYAKRLHLQLALFCIVSSATIVWSILPRRDRFVAPGPLLEPAQHPQLFRWVRQTAAVTGQAMPSEVYLVPDVNAWVAERGGVLGFGSRRVMGLGLPLLRLLSIDEFRAVLAHEFGHFHGGDTRLGPWIYKTRAAIGRTIEGLGGGALHKPFLWYGKLFLRVTHAVSRRQELSADALAAGSVGARPLAAGLRKVHGAGPAFAEYWRREVLPILDAGLRPPIAEGWARFTRAPAVADALRRTLDAALGAAESDPYDTHPPLAERLAALRAEPAGPAAGNDEPATSLLADLPGAELRLLETLASAPVAQRLAAVSWDEAARRAFLPAWSAMVREQATALEGVRCGDVARAVAAGEIEARLRLPPGLDDTPEQRARFARWVLGAAVCVVLARLGWSLHAPPGEGVSLRRDGLSMAPFEDVERIASGELGPEAWEESCLRLGLRDEPLLDPGAPPAAPPGGSSFARMASLRRGD